MDDPDVLKMVTFMTEANKKLDEERKDLSSIDFSSLPILKKSAWSIRIRFQGLETPDGRRVDTRRPGASSGQDLVQKFNMTCFNKLGPGMNAQLPRYLSEFVGLPNSKQVVESVGWLSPLVIQEFYLTPFISSFIRQAFAIPHPPFESCLPTLLVISSKLRQHEAAFKPFLDSLPKPFTWFIAPQDVEEEADERRFYDAKHDVEKYMKLALQNKVEGNEAFAAKNGLVAVAAYQEAIRFVGKAEVNAEAVKEKTDEVDQLSAICYANCSAARLLPGRSMDARKALEDARHAIIYDEKYAKG